MAFDRGLEERLYEHFIERHDLTVKKMFGGLCFLLSGNMCCAIIEDKLLARVGAVNYTSCLAKAYVTEMDFTGKPIKTMVYVMPNGFDSDQDLANWLNICINFTDTLAPKKPKTKKLKPIKLKPIKLKPIKKRLENKKRMR